LSQWRVSSCVPILADFPQNAKRREPCGGLVFGVGQDGIVGGLSGDKGDISKKRVG